MKTMMDYMNNGKYKELKVKDLKKLLNKLDDETDIFYIDGYNSGKEVNLSNSQVEIHNSKIVFRT